MNRGSVDFLLRATNFLPDLNFYSLGFGRIGKNPIGLVGIVEGIRSFFYLNPTSSIFTFIIETCPLPLHWLGYIWGNHSLPSVHYYLVRNLVL